MTDIEKILAEIQKRIEFQKTCIKNDYRLTGRAEEEIIFEYQQLINIINAFPKKPVSEDLEEVSKKYSSCIYLEEVLSDDDKEVLREKLINTFKTGAQWKEQRMMANAVDGFVIEDIEEGNGDFLLSAEYLPKNIGLKDRQKVKVIVIKDN